MFCGLAISHRTLKWIVGGSVLVALTGVLIAATRSYYIQEMLAALGSLYRAFYRRGRGIALESRGKAVLQQAWGRKPLSEHWYKI
jgi:hypothetical protein